MVQQPPPPTTVTVTLRIVQAEALRRTALFYGDALEAAGSRVTAALLRDAAMELLLALGTVILAEHDRHGEARTGASSPAAPRSTGGGARSAAGGTDTADATEGEEWP